MGKRNEISVGEAGVHEDPGVSAARSRIDDITHRAGPERESRSGAAEAVPDDVNEHLTRDLARVRAKFSMDAPPGEPWLKTAWTSGLPIEEYEAEFVDAMADCLGAGLSLQDALTCWDSGELVAEPEDEREIDGASADDEPALVVAPAQPRRPSGGHRVVVR